MRLSRIVFLFPIFFMVLYACNNSDDLTMGDELVTLSTDVIYNDTSALRFYTIIRDSVISSGTSVALVGSYSDGNFGAIRASSFFQVGAPSYSTLNSDASFDSITLSLYSSGYTYGDTTGKFFTIQAREVLANLDEHRADDGYRYNIDSVLYDTDNILGSKTFEVQPKFKRRVSIPLSQTFGETLFTMAMNKTSDITSSTTFVKYFKGIALMGPSANPCVMGFAVDDSSYMRLYYKAGGTSNTSTYMDFKIINTDYQFNHVVANRGSSPLSVLTGKEDQIISTDCDNESYCQASFGVMTKIEMPYIKKLTEHDDNIKILKAELILSPVSGTYEKVQLPTSLALYSINTVTHELGSAVINSSGYQVSPALTMDYRYGADTQYSFDITYYIASILAEDTYDTPAITVALPSSLYYSTLDRAIFGDRLRSSNTSKLKIWYWRY